MAGSVASEMILGVLKDHFPERSEESLLALTLKLQGRPAEPCHKTSGNKRYLGGEGRDKKSDSCHEKPQSPKPNAKPCLVPHYPPLLQGEAGSDCEHPARSRSLNESTEGLIVKYEERERNSDHEKKRSMFGNYGFYNVDLSRLQRKVVGSRTVDGSIGSIPQPDDLSTRIRRLFRSGVDECGPDGPGPSGFRRWKFAGNGLARRRHQPRMQSSTGLQRRGCGINNARRRLLHHQLR